MVEGVAVHASEDIGLTDRMAILLNHAFLQSPNIATLYAYDPEIACTNDHLRPLLGHDGSAAILYTSAREPENENTTDTDIAFAVYRPTVTDALLDARKSWCGRNDWYFATTHPLGDDIATKKAGYVSWDVDLIERKLNEFHGATPQERLNELLAFTSSDAELGSDSEPPATESLTSGTAPEAPAVASEPR